MERSRVRARARARAERCYRLLSCPESAAEAAVVAAEQLEAVLAAEQLEQPPAKGAATSAAIQ